MVKCAIGTSWVFLGASGVGVSETVAVEALGVAVSLRSFLDFEPLRQEEEGGEEDGTSSGLTEPTTQVACLDSLALRSLLRYLAEPIVTALALWMEFLMKVKS